MNIISNAPSWAQKTFTTFASREPVAGTEQSPITDEYKNEAGQAIAGIGFLSAMDEVEGTDEAMGQPGVVKAGDTTLHFEGGEADMKAVLNSTDEEGNAASIYFGVEQDGLWMLGAVNKESGVEVEGAVLTPQPDGDFGGYQIAGKVQ